MKLNNLINLIGLLSDDNKTIKFDLKTDEGYNEFNKVMKNLRESDKTVFSLCNIDLDELLDNISLLANKIHDSSEKNKSQEEKSKELPKKANVKRKEIDHSVGEEFKRPSELLTVDQKLQLHKLVQEYVDTTIKPFNKGILTNDQINDAYAGLYEFAAWILKKDK